MSCCYFCDNFSCETSSCILNEGKVFTDFLCPCFSSSYSFYFRFHRGGFDDSVSTLEKFVSLFDFFTFLDSHYCNKTFSLTFYSFDNRIKSYTFLVCVSNNPVGFLSYYGGF